MPDIAIPLLIGLGVAVGIELNRSIQERKVRCLGNEVTISGEAQIALELMIELGFESDKIRETVIKVSEEHPDADANELINIVIEYERDDT